MKYTDSEGIALQIEDRIQDKTHGTCEVLSVIDTNIRVRNVQTGEIWHFAPEGWIAGNWDLVSSVSEWDVHWVCPVCAHGQTEWIDLDNYSAAEVLCENCNSSIEYGKLDKADQDKFTRAIRKATI